VHEHREGPDDVETRRDLDRADLAGDQSRGLGLEAGLAQLLQALGQHRRPHLHAVVVTAVEIRDDGDAAAQRAAADVEQPVVRLQPLRAQERHLEIALQLPELDRADEMMPPDAPVQGQHAAPHHPLKAIHLES
jgi:hypothetical protein